MSLQRDIHPHTRLLGNQKRVFRLLGISKTEKRVHVPLQTHISLFFTAWSRFPAGVATGNTDKQ